MSWLGDHILREKGNAGLQRPQHECSVCHPPSSCTTCRHNRPSQGCGERIANVFRCPLNHYNSFFKSSMSGSASRSSLGSSLEVR